MAISEYKPEGPVFKLSDHLHAYRRVPDASTKSGYTIIPIPYDEFMEYLWALDD